MWKLTWSTETGEIFLYPEVEKRSIGHLSRLYQWMTKILKLLFGNCRILTSNASISWTSRLKTLYLYKVSSRIRYFFRFPRKILQNDRWNLVWTWNFNSDEFLAIFSLAIKSHIFFSVNSAKQTCRNSFSKSFSSFYPFKFAFSFFEF